MLTKLPVPYDLCDYEIFANLRLTLHQEEVAGKQQEAGQGFHHSVTAAFDEVGDTASQKHGAAYQTYQGRLNIDTRFV